MPQPKLTPKQKAAREKTRNALRAEKKKAAKVTPQANALNNLAENEKVPLLPLGFCNTLNLAFRHCGGIEAMIDLCAYCADECEEAGRVVIMYRETVMDDRKDLIPEDLCRKADISPARLLGVLAKAAFQRNIDLSKMLMAMHSPALIGAASTYGQEKEGHQDRKMLLQAAGVVPMGGSKGIAVTVNNANVQGAEDIEYGGLPDFAEDAILITSE
jgi:hypothetical protein